MPQNDTVYTITDQDIATLTEEMRGRRGGADVRPDRRASASIRGHGAGESSPLAASTLSLFICGAGQMYNRQGKLGALLFLTEVLVVSVNWAVIQMWSTLVEMADLFSVSEWRLLIGVTVADYLALIVMLASVHQAYRFADEEAGFAGAGNPIFSGLASIILPGWGQLVNAQAGKALFFLFSVLSGAFAVSLVLFTPFVRLLESTDAGRLLIPQVTTATMVTVGLAGIMWILSVYDAIIVGSFHRRMV